MLPSEIGQTGSFYPLLCFIRNQKLQTGVSHINICFFRKNKMCTYHTLASASSIVIIFSLTIIISWIRSSSLIVISLATYPTSSPAEKGTEIKNKKTNTCKRSHRKWSTLELDFIVLWNLVTTWIWLARRYHIIIDSEEWKKKVPTAAKSRTQPWGILRSAKRGVGSSSRNDVLGFISSLLQIGDMPQTADLHPPSSYLTGYELAQGAGHVSPPISRTTSSG